MTLPGEMRGTQRSRGNTLKAGSRLHLLLVVGAFPPVGGGGVIRVVKLIKYLAPLGWQVTVLCSVEPPGEHWDETLLTELPDDVSVIRVPHPIGRYAQGLKSTAKKRMDRRSRRFRFLRAVRSMVQSLIAIPDGWAAWALRIAIAPPTGLGQPDVILASGPPHSVHPLGARLARRLNVPFIMDLRDEWTLRPSSRSSLPWRRWLERRLESRSIGAASRVITVSAASVERYADRYPDQAEKFIDMPNGFDPADFDGLPPAISGSTEANTLTIGYAGSFQIGVDVRPIFAAIGAVVEESMSQARSVRFELVGPLSPEHVDAARRFIPAAQLGVRPFVPHRDALELMRGWDVLLIVANDGQASLAGKTYECLVFRKPILLIAPEGPATELVRSTRAGAIADPSDVAAMQGATRQAIAMADEPSFQGAADDVLERYDRRRQASRWSALLREAIASRHARTPG